MVKEEFLRKIADVDAYSASVCDLLSALLEEQFQQTKEGTRDQYKQYRSDEAQCALAWMNEHYDNIEATIRAAMLLAVALTDTTSALCSEGSELIEEETA